MTQDDVLKALGTARTAQQCDQALALADAWVDAHPDDLDVRMAMEGVLMIREMWDLPLDQWSQADRDALVGGRE